MSLKESFIAKIGSENEHPAIVISMMHEKLLKTIQKT